MMTKNNQLHKKKPIRNLEDLRNAKRQLKAEMRQTEKAQENSVVNKAFNLISTFSHDNTFASSKIENSLQWLGNKASAKYPMKGFSKILISGLIMIAVPIITDKVQDYIKKKL